MTVLRGGQRTEDQRLARLVPGDFDHVVKYPLSAAPVAPRGVPVVFGVNWYSALDTPVKRVVGGRTEWWAGQGQLGYVRGGHCVCAPSQYQVDAAAWWTYYDQLQEGKCVGEGSSRCMSLLNRVRYDPTWLYWEAQRSDEFPGGAYPGATPQAEGTTVRAAFDVLRTQGHVRVVRGKPVAAPSLADGVAANHWATSLEDLRSVWNSPRYDEREAAPLLNSWGRGYPHLVWLGYPVWERLLSEDGEATMLVQHA